ncbi:thioredoxin [Candidatus Woesearchaeota archaeon]|nr:thioredoxin [Candidatus Woesearchaeota archaeon]MBT5396911.1 thioredoxin [Candidatus Woesearchaeota archaeon]MBT6367104.1 thioredoxin [Candidatus Woesearchaeota archaeon]MBT7762322.1 thioredoxin [Candidatus Woesearchaeota archaeon]
MIKELNTENLKEAIMSSTPVIVDFWASWCGPCKMLAPVFEELSEEYDGTLTFTKISTEDNPDAGSMYNVAGIPCLIVFKDGKEIDRIVGFAPKPLLKQKIDAVLEKV